MREYFEHAYEGFCNSMEPFLHFAQCIGEVGKVIFVYITIPVWIIPYAIIKNSKKASRRVNVKTEE